MFHRVELGTVGRLSNEPDIFRDLQVFCQMPTRLIDLQHHKVLLRVCTERRKAADRKKKEEKKAKESISRRSNMCIYCRERRTYPSDVKDQEWAILEPLIPAAKPGGRPQEIERREIVNGILYVLRSGCPWRMLPHDLPNWSTVYLYFREWKRAGIWEQVNTARRPASACLPGTRSRTKRGHSG